MPKGRKPSQNSIIQDLEFIGQKWGFQVKIREKTELSKTSKRNSGSFFPDVVWTPSLISTKKQIYVFEVEKTVVNNTIYKSLVSLLDYLITNQNSIGRLVVPENQVDFSLEGVKIISRILRKFSKKGKGKRKKIQIEVLSFENVRKYWKELSRHNVGQPPKLKNLF